MGEILPGFVFRNMIGLLYPRMRLIEPSGKIPQGDVVAIQSGLLTVRTGVLPQIDVPYLVDGNRVLFSQLFGAGDMKRYLLFLFGPKHRSQQRGCSFGIFTRGYGLIVLPQQQRGFCPVSYADLQEEVVASLFYRSRALFASVCLFHRNAFPQDEGCFSFLCDSSCKKADTSNISPRFDGPSSLFELISLATLVWLGVKRSRVRISLSRPFFLLCTLAHLAPCSVVRSVEYAGTLLRSLPSQNATFAQTASQKGGRFEPGAFICGNLNNHRHPPLTGIAANAGTRPRYKTTANIRRPHTVVASGSPNAI